MTGISFTAILYQAKTDPSGGWKVTFDVPESDANAILELSKCRDIILSVGIIPTAQPKSKDEFDLDMGEI
jgi:hypothetical protein